MPLAVGESGAGEADAAWCLTPAGWRVNSPVAEFAPNSATFGSPVDVGVHGELLTPGPFWQSSSSVFCHHGCSPELPRGEFCPEDPRASRVLMATPVGCWNTNPNSVHARCRDTVYGCTGLGRRSRCSWAWSQQIGLFVLPGLARHAVSHPTMHHERRYRQRKWERVCAPVLTPGASS